MANNFRVKNLLTNNTTISGSGYNYFGIDANENSFGIFNGNHYPINHFGTEASGNYFGDDTPYNSFGSATDTAAVFINNFGIATDNIVSTNNFGNNAINNQFGNSVGYLNQFGNTSPNNDWYCVYVET
jgi:hypothetical protein